MKKIIFILCMLFSITAINAKIVRNGNQFEVVTTTDTKTPYTFKDKDGKIYQVFQTPKGALYVKKISKKTGKEYKYYLPK